MSSYEQLVAEIKNEFINARKSHDWEHTERVYNLCLELSKNEKIDREVLKLAALLHDIGRVEQDQSKGKLNHAERGVKKAAQILEKYDLPEIKIKKILHCIETHRFRGKKPPLSLEAKILFDADKLDAIGAIGIGRAFVFAGEVGAKVHNKNIELKKTQPYTEEDTAYREYLVKLIKIKERLYTEEGRRIAESRHKFMQDFFDRLNREVDGEL